MGGPSTDDSYLWVPGTGERTEDDDGFDKYLELIAEKQTFSQVRQRGS